MYSIGIIIICVQEINPRLEEPLAYKENILIQDSKSQRQIKREKVS